MVNYCDKCGSPVKSDDLFCNTCGAQLNRSKIWVSSGAETTSSPMQATSQPSYRTERPRKYYRSRDDRWIAGVCGGLGEYFGIDPILIRIAFIIAALTTTGLIVYILLAIFVKENPYQKPRHDDRERYRTSQ